MGRSPRNLPFQMAELAVEIPEAREGHQVDAVGRRRRPHGQKGRHDLVMQGAGRVGELRQVAPGAPGELIQREFQGFRHALAILPERGDGRLSADLIDIAAVSAPPRMWPLPETRRLRLPAN